MREDRPVRGVKCLSCQSYSLVRWKPTDNFAKCLECNEQYSMDWIEFVRGGGLEWTTHRK